MRKVLKSFALLSLLLASACAEIKLREGAEKVIATKNPAPNNCKFIGMIVGHSRVTFNSRAANQWALNDLRNKALTLGAHYVQVENQSNKDIPVFDYNTNNYLGSTYDVTQTGNAYRCESSEIGPE
jgi:hypothetical protein